MLLFAPLIPAFLFFSFSSLLFCIVEEDEGDNGDDADSRSAERELVDATVKLVRLLANLRCVLFVFVLSFHKIVFFVFP